MICAGEGEQEDAGDVGCACEVEDAGSVWVWVRIYEFFTTKTQRHQGSFTAEVAESAEEFVEFFGQDLRDEQDLRSVNCGTFGRYRSHC